MEEDAFAFPKIALYNTLRVVERRDDPCDFWATRAENHILGKGTRNNSIHDEES
jgi:hypothetical protein